MEPLAKNVDSESKDTNKKCDIRADSTSTVIPNIVAEPQLKGRTRKGDEKRKNSSKEKNSKENKENRKVLEDNLANEGRFTVKTPKGTRDYDSFEMSIREKVFGIIINCFKKHGGVTIETPLFELKEILTGKYGEDSKLIFDLQDQGGECCSLRYDLTVPFARYCAMHGIKQIKRYQIGRVYRRDNPVMTKGRFREFYQCDFDIAGEFDLMVPDAEALKVITEILDETQVGNYVIKVNHRQLLDGIFSICGVPEEKFRSICSAVDKLDKTPWDEVRKEMIEQKGLDSEIADKIQVYVRLQGEPRSLLKWILDEKLCESNSIASKALEELALLFDYLDCYGCLEKVVFDLSLARGLDYYTGVIYEGVLTDSSQMGSICGGGRYDRLIGIFSAQPVPSVGFSIGIERIFTILEERASKERDSIRVCPTDVLVCSIEENLLKERMKICSELWKAGIRAELVPRNKVKIVSQLNYANSNNIPFAIVFGSRELQEETLQCKNLFSGQQESLKRSELITVLRERLRELNENPSLQRKVTQKHQKNK